MNQLGRAIGIIEHIFDLYRDSDMNADSLCEMLPYIIATAKVPRFITHARYASWFHHVEERGEVFSLYKTNLEVICERIKDFIPEGISNFAPERTKD